MRIELLPVLELGYHNPALAFPPARYYWENPAQWASYRANCYRQAGFAEDLPMYAPGSPFCRLPALSDASLVKIMADHTAGWRAGEYDREQASNLYGGYVLRVDKQDAWFPQCCGGLSDIRYWERLAQGQPSACEGHPGRW